MPVLWTSCHPCRHAFKQIFTSDKHRKLIRVVTSKEHVKMKACVTCCSPRTAGGERRWWWERSCATDHQPDGRGRSRSAACLWIGSGSGSPPSHRCSPAQSNCRGKEKWCDCALGLNAELRKVIIKKIMYEYKNSLSSINEKVCFTKA